MEPPRFLLILVGLVAACASPTNDPGACVWPAQLDAKDSGGGYCQARRHYLRCQGGGVTAICTSDEPDQCPGLSASMPGVAFTCVEQCKPSEYGISCGGIGRSGAPPANCSQGSPPTPGGGITFHCCPCGR